ncbi:MAG: hypothetical protein GY913_07035 [Proteobacteria bacterium]|nr:hypothetical protein [Pseudomonadota bacterium]
MGLSLTCGACAHENEPGSRYCVKCGGAVGSVNLCAACGAGLAAGAAFCTGCGGRVRDSEIPPGPGSVSGGIWDKAAGELVRRVSLKEMGGKFDSVLRNDALHEAAGDGLWGLLFKAGKLGLEQAQEMKIEVPTGCVAAVMVDGRVTELLPPGRQTTIGSFKRILEEVRGTDDPSKSLWDRAKAAFASGGVAMVEDVVDRVLSDQLDRTSFFLIDRRPIPVQLQISSPGQSDDQTTTLGVIVTAHLVGGDDQTAVDGLTTFINRLMGDRESLNAEVIHQRLLPHVDRISKDAAQRFQGEDGLDLERFEHFLRNRLDTDFGREHGLSFDVLVAPRASVISLNIHLGQAQTPDLRPCVNATCSSEIKLGQRFCTGCAQEQPTPVSPNRGCSACDARVPMGSAFCTACGTTFTGGDPRELRLVTSDNKQIELDLVLRAQGDREVKDPNRLIASVASAASRGVRLRTYEELASPGGFTALDDELQGVALEAVRALDLRLLDLRVLDVRSRDGIWAMNARAEIERARGELTVGREWLEVDGERLDLEALTLEVVLRREVVQRDHEFARVQSEIDHARRLDAARLADRSARADQADTAAELDVQDASRAAERDVAVDAAERSTARHLRDQDHADSLSEVTQGAAVDEARGDAARKAEQTDQGHRIDLAKQAAEHAAEQARAGIALDSERARTAADDLEHAERLALEREQDAADRSSQRELSELRAAAEIQKERLAAEAEAERLRLDKLKDLDAGQIIATAAHGRALTDAEAGALAQAASDGDKRAIEYLEKLVQEKDSAKTELVEMMKELHGQTADQKNKDADRQAAMFEQMMKLMAQNTQAMAGQAQQTQAQVVEAHAGAADSARSMSEKSMDAMSKVAASKAAPGASKACTSCGAGLMAADVFCGECGTRQA